MAVSFAQYLDDPEQNPLGGLMPPDGGADAAPAPEAATAPQPTPEAAPPAADAPPATQEPAAPADPLDQSINSLLAQQQATPVAQPPPFELAPPPMKEEKGEGPAVLGTILDVLLNKGRNVPQMIAQFGGGGDDTDYENWKRQADYASKRYALTAPRHGVGVAANPLQSLLAAERLKQGKTRLGLSLTDEQRKGQALKNSQAHWEDQNTVDNETALNYGKMYVDAGGDPKMVQGKTAAQIAKLAPTMNFGAQRTGQLAEADVKHATEKAASTSAATKQDRIDIARASTQGQQDVKTQPIDDYIDSLKANPSIRAHFRDDGKAMRARMQINPRGTQTAVDAITSNNRALDALDDLIRIERNWKALGVSKYAPKTGVTSWVVDQLNNAAPGSVEYDEYQRAAELEQDYHDLMKEVEGVKARIAQSSGSATERQEAQSAMPGIGNFTASQRLSGTRNMLRTNTAANLSPLGMVPDEPGEHETRVNAEHGQAPPAPHPAAPKPKSKPMPVHTGAVVKDDAGDDWELSP